MRRWRCHAVLIGPDGALLPSRLICAARRLLFFSIALGGVRVSRRPCPRPLATAGP